MSKNKLTIEAMPGQPTIISTREFDVPREKLFDACTDPDKISQWWSAGGKYPMTIESFEPRRGGTWRFVTTDADGGNPANFSGVFHEVTAPERTIQTWEFEGLPEAGHVLLETSRFEELEDDRTRLVVVQSFQSVADRDGMVASGMEEGSSAAYEALAKLVGSE